MRGITLLIVVAISVAALPAFVSANRATGKAAVATAAASRSLLHTVNLMLSGRYVVEKAQVGLAFHAAKRQGMTPWVKTAVQSQTQLESGAYCTTSICDFQCPSGAACCDSEVCYYNNFWFDWGCCGTNSAADSASCCGKMTGGGIAVIVILVLSFIVCICGCVWCCCCRAARAPPLIATQTTAYVVMPNGQMQPVAQGQALPPGAYPGGVAGYQGNYQGGAYQMPMPQQYQAPPQGMAYAPPMGMPTGTGPEGQRPSQTQTQPMPQGQYPGTYAAPPTYSNLPQQNTGGYAPLTSA